MMLKMIFKDMITRILYLTLHRLGIKRFTYQRPSWMCDSRVSQSDGVHVGHQDRHLTDHCRVETDSEDSHGDEEHTFIVIQGDL